MYICIYVYIHVYVYVHLHMHAYVSATLDGGAQAHTCTCVYTHMSEPSQDGNAMTQRTHFEQCAYLWQDALGERQCVALLFVFLAMCGYTFPYPATWRKTESREGRESVCV